MLRYKTPDGQIQEFDSQSWADVVKLVNEKKIGGLLFDSDNVQDADILVEQVRRIFGRTSETTAAVCRELDGMKILNLEL